MRIVVEYPRMMVLVGVTLLRNSEPLVMTPIFFLRRTTEKVR